MKLLRQFLPFLLFAATAVAAQQVMRLTQTEYCLSQLTMALYYAVVAMALSLLMGFAGQVSLGHGAFFAIGGYMSAVLTTHDLSAHQQTAWAGWLKSAHCLVAKPDLYGGQVLVTTPWAAFGAAMAVALLVACLIGWPALRLKGHYLAMATLGFGLIIYKIVLGTPLTGAADGITGVPEWGLLPGLKISGSKSARVANFYLACGIVLALLYLLGNLVRSRIGRALQAIHDQESAANAMGINTTRYKLKVFIISAMMAAAAGVFFTHHTGGIGPSEAGALKSVRYLALAVVGGIANLWGVAVVSTAINFCSLRGWFGSYDNAVFGGLLILIISLAPEGPFQAIGTWLRRWFRQDSQATTPGKGGL